MAAKRKDDPKPDHSEASTKLGRLLETENALEAMLKQARREAQALVEAARVAADDRVRQFDLDIEEENRALRERITRDRTQTISAIKEEALREATRLDELDDAEVAELALHVVGLVVGEPDPRGLR